MNKNQLGIEKVNWFKPDQGVSAAGVVPTEAEFFKDHFPGFPVLPGVLALEMLHVTVLKFWDLCEKTESHLALKKITAAKFSKYLNPGDAWESLIKISELSDEKLVVQGQLLNQGKVAVSARLQFEVVKTPQPLSLI